MEGKHHLITIKKYKYFISTIASLRKQLKDEKIENRRLVKRQELFKLFIDEKIEEIDAQIRSIIK